MSAFIQPIPTLPHSSRHLLSSRNTSRSVHVFRAIPRRTSIICQLSANATPLPSQNGGTHPDIRLMACDLDGTLLNKQVTTSDRNISTVKRLLSETDILFVPATGKSRAGAMNAMAALGEELQRIYPNGCPGVFLQGLIVFGLDGRVVYEKECDEELAKIVVGLARKLDISLLAYSRDSLVCEKRDEFVDLLPSYREPEAEAVGEWERVIGKRSLNKFIFMAEPSRIDEIRPYVDDLVGDKGHLTQAQANMLEVLPPKSSKGYGVTQLLKSVGVSPENVLAIGDAENDLELLEMVGYSCAVENALPSVKKVAQYTDFKSNNDDGVAEAIERFILSKVDVAV